MFQYIVYSLCEDQRQNLDENLKILWRKKITTKLNLLDLKIKLLKFVPTIHQIHARTE